MQLYADGKKCIADFKTLMEKCTVRKEANVPPEELAIIHGVENEIEMAVLYRHEKAK